MIKVGDIRRWTSYLSDETLEIVGIEGNDVYYRYIETDVPFKDGRKYSWSITLIEDHTAIDHSYIIKRDIKDWLDNL